MSRREIFSFKLNRTSKNLVRTSSFVSDEIKTAVKVFPSHEILLLISLIQLQKKKPLPMYFLCYFRVCNFLVVVKNR